MKPKKADPINVPRSSHLSVMDHYDKWPFPGEDFLSREGLLLLRHLTVWLGEETQSSERSLQVVDVGCGTGNTLTALAKHFPNVHFVGVDVSKAAIDIASSRAADKKISNVTFRQADITKGLSKFGLFKVVLSLGVLHHVRGLRVAFRRMVQITERSGYLVVWFYGSHGRTKHQLNQRLIKLLADPSQRFNVAQTFLDELGLRFAIHTGFYTPKGSGEEGRQWLLHHPSWLADQMIPAFEKSVSMKDILHLLKENHVHFVNWLGVPTHLSHYTSSQLLVQLFDKLAPQEQLVAIDYLIKPEYYFVVGKRPNRDASKCGAD